MEKEDINHFAPPGSITEVREKRKSLIYTWRNVLTFGLIGIITIFLFYIIICGPSDLQDDAMLYIGIIIGAATASIWQNSNRIE